MFQLSSGRTYPFNRERDTVLSRTNNVSFVFMLFQIFCVYDKKVSQLQSAFTRSTARFLAKGKRGTASPD